MSLVPRTSWTGAGDNHCLSRLFLQHQLDLWIMQTEKLANMKRLRLSRAVQTHVLTTSFLLLKQLFITVYCSGKCERTVYMVGKEMWGKRPLDLGWTIPSPGTCRIFLFFPSPKSLGHTPHPWCLEARHFCRDKRRCVKIIFCQRLDSGCQIMLLGRGWGHAVVSFLMVEWMPQMPTSHWFGVKTIKPDWAPCHAINQFVMPKAWHTVCVSIQSLQLDLHLLSKLLRDKLGSDALS